VGGLWRGVWEELEKDVILTRHLDNNNQLQGKLAQQFQKQFVCSLIGFRSDQMHLLDC
jgi:hypothetical protein